MAKTHRLKTLSARGDKRAELRRADRDFAVGDMLLLDEVTADGVVTGAFIAARVTHIVYASDGPWLAPGHWFAALPPPSAGRPWREVLRHRGAAPITLDDIEFCYRALASERHPDAGGSDALMSELNAARDAARRELGG